MKTLLLLLIAFITTSTIVFAQSDERSVGVTASVQSQQFDFLVPIWVSSRVTLAPSLAFSSAQDIGSDLTIGVMPRFYLSEPVEAVPYLAFRLATAIGIPDEGNTIYDFITGVGFGGEYFIKPKFSVGIELQGNLTISDGGSFRFANPGNVNFNTATALTANIYF